MGACECVYVHSQVPGTSPGSKKVGIGRGDMGPPLSWGL